MRRLGTHLLIELGGVEPALLDDPAWIRETMVLAAKKGRATILNTSFHEFSPQGVSGVIVLAESHISVHTWPEEGYAAVDVFTCGDRAMPHLAAAYLVQAFAPRSYKVREIPRGVPEQESSGDGMAEGFGRTFDRPVGAAPAEGGLA